MKKIVITIIMILAFVVGFLLQRQHASKPTNEISGTVFAEDMTIDFPDNLTIDINKPTTVVRYSDMNITTAWDYSEIKLDTVNFGGPYSVIFSTKSGSLTIKCDGDELKIEADCDMDEAAEAFFYQLVKPMADAYIREKLKDF